jgi:hypothetical protein
MIMKAKLVRKILAGALPVVAIGTGVFVGSMNKKPAENEKEKDTKDEPSPEPVAKSSDDSTDEKAKSLNRIDLSPEPKLKYFGEGHTVKPSDVKNTIREPQMFTIPKSYAAGDPEDPRPVMLADKKSADISELDARLKSLEEAANSKDDLTPIEKMLLYHETGKEDPSALDKWYEKHVIRMELKAKKWRRRGGYDAGKLGIDYKAKDVPNPREVIGVMEALASITDNSMREKLTKVYVYDAFEYTDGERINEITGVIASAARMRCAKNCNTNRLRIFGYSTYADMASDKPLQYAPYREEVKPYTEALNKFVESALCIQNGKLNPDLIPQYLCGYPARVKYVLDGNDMPFDDWIREVADDVKGIRPFIAAAETGSIRPFITDACDQSISTFEEEISSYMEVREAMLYLAKIKDTRIRKLLTGTFIEWAFVDPCREYRKKILSRIKFEARNSSDDADEFVKINKYTTNEPAVGHEAIAEIQRNIDDNKFKDWYRLELAAIGLYKKEYSEDHPVRLLDDNKPDSPFRYPSPAEIAPIIRALVNIKDEHKRVKLISLYRLYAFDYPSYENYNRISNVIYHFEDKWSKKKDGALLPQHNKSYWSIPNGCELSDKPLESADMDKYDVDLGTKMNAFWSNRMTSNMYISRISPSRARYINNSKALTFETWNEECRLDRTAAMKEFGESYAVTNNALREMPGHAVLSMLMRELGYIKNDEVRTKLADAYIQWSFITPIYKYANIVGQRILTERHIEKLPSGPIPYDVNIYTSKIEIDEDYKPCE